MMNIQTTIVMPNNAPATKRAATKDYGATIVEYDPEKAIIEAVQFLFYRMKLVVEPSGALGLAALLSQVVVPEGRVGIILSGGNIDAGTMITILNGVIP